MNWGWSWRFRLSVASSVPRGTLIAYDEADARKRARPRTACEERFIGIPCWSRPTAAAAGMPSSNVYRAQRAQELGRQPITGRTNARDDRFLTSLSKEHTQ